MHCSSESQFRKASAYFMCQYWHYSTRGYARQVFCDIFSSFLFLKKAWLLPQIIIRFGVFHEWNL